jgi:hypothetical protein
VPGTLTDNADGVLPAAVDTATGVTTVPVIVAPIVEGEVGEPPPHATAAIVATQEIAIRIRVMLRRKQTPDPRNRKKACRKPQLVVWSQQYTAKHCCPLWGPLLTAVRTSVRPGRVIHDSLPDTRPSPDTVRRFTIHCLTPRPSPLTFTIHCLTPGGEIK